MAENRRRCRKSKNPGRIFRLENEELIEGFIDLRITHPFDFSEKIQEFAFTFTPGEETRSDEAEFNRIRALEAASLAENHLPGTAWFRHIAESEEIRSPRLFRRRNLSESFDIISGARAVSENLALDRELILADFGTEETIPVSEIKGITTAAIDWSSRLPDEEVPVDRLAMFLPED